jgi:Predicted transcriptional regulator
MNTDGFKKLDRMLFIIKLFETRGTRWRVQEIVKLLGSNFDEDTILKDLKQLSYTGLLPIKQDGRYWTLMGGAVVPKLNISLSDAEVGALYLAGRLLAQTQDEQNWHVEMALKKLVDAMPPALREEQNMVLRLLATPTLQSNDDDDITAQLDLSQTFQVLMSGWLTRHEVKLTYQPAFKRGFSCTFRPYLLEPSAIGRTIYAIGWSSVVDDLRIFKLERIQKAEFTNTEFTIPSAFNGPELLSRAWGVMYGDGEPVTVRLRFSDAVTQRLRETRWHPTQKITLTRDGCIWSAQIGDLMEIEPWVRGWGSDCEVLEPAELREHVIQHVQRQMSMYNLNAASPQTSFDPTKFNRSMFRKDR